MIILLLLNGNDIFLTSKFENGLFRWENGVKNLFLEENYENPNRKYADENQ